MDVRTAATTTAALAALYAGQSLGELTATQNRLRRTLVGRAATNTTYAAHVRTCAALVEQTIAGRTTGV